MIGVSIGLPKTAAVDENTKCFTPVATIASSTDSAPMHVVAVVAGRIADRVATDSQAAKCMTASISCVSIACADARGVADVAVDQRRRHRRLRGRGFAVPGREVVVDHDPVAGVPERLDGVAADVAGAAGDQDRAHGRPIE